MRVNVRKPLGGHPCKTPLTCTSAGPLPLPADGLVWAVRLLVKGPPKRPAKNPSNIGTSRELKKYWVKKELFTKVGPALAKPLTPMTPLPDVTHATAEHPCGAPNPQP